MIDQDVGLHAVCYQRIAELEAKQQQLRERLDELKSAAQRSADELNREIIGEGPASKARCVLRLRQALKNTEGL